jgi:hypothetical protein
VFYVSPSIGGARISRAGCRCLVPSATRCTCVPSMRIDDKGYATTALSSGWPLDLNCMCSLFLLSSQTLTAMGVPASSLPSSWQITNAGNPEVTMCAVRILTAESLLAHLRSVPQDCGYQWGNPCNISAMVCHSEIHTPCLHVPFLKVPHPG